MPRANFDDSLRLPTKAQTQKAEKAGEAPPGPLARGPVPRGDRLIWVYVWLIQNGPSGRAAAAHGWGYKQGGFRGTWMVEMKMPRDSDDFTPKRAALATAMALVKRGNTKEVDWWSEPVMITK